MSLTNKTQIGFNCNIQASQQDLQVTVQKHGKWHQHGQKLVMANKSLRQWSCWLLKSGSFQVTLIYMARSYHCFCASLLLFIVLDNRLVFCNELFYVCALSYLKGLYSFGLMETRFYDQAEKVAMEVRFSHYIQIMQNCILQNDHTVLINTFFSKHLINTSQSGWTITFMKDLLLIVYWLGLITCQLGIVCSTACC